MDWRDFCRFAVEDAEDILRFRSPLPRSSLAAPFRPAAVLVALVPDEGQRARIILTRRDERLTHHPGQISFPGGVVEPGDSDAVAAARREAEEEIGADGRNMEVFGVLPAVLLPTGFEMTPVPAILSAQNWRPQKEEVAEILDIPAEFLLAPERYFLRRLPGLSFTSPAIRWRQHEIWGATAVVLQRLAYSFRRFRGEA